MDSEAYEKVAIDCGVREVELDSWSEFYEYIRQMHANHPAFMYRGQANAEWPITSRLDRLERQFPEHEIYIGNPPQKNMSKSPPACREEHLTAFKRSVMGRRGTNPPSLSEEEWWSLGQHHGLATPLTDWTLSPYVALFFAFEEKFATIGDGSKAEPNSRIVYGLSTSVIMGEKPDSSVPRIIAPIRDLSPRIASQSGLFLRMPRNRDVEGFVRSTYTEDSTETWEQHARCILDKIVIPNSDRIECLMNLNKMNINRATLFPDLDGAASYVNAMWELNFDTGLGNLPVPSTEEPVIDD